ncbi:MAG: type III pantothenate kinase [Proteobacteria bacterium]|nr:type III pantothenate kinase [Pseudomonadota bacterium]
MTALLLDVGNTRLKWGILDDDNIRRTGHIAHDRIRELGLQELTSKLPRRVDAVFASNVAGTSFATRLSGVVSMHCHCDVRFARSERRGWGVTNSYRQPRRMGVDRWVAMVGAWAETQAACLIVDAGTAVTIDALDDDGVHLGGQIIPGVVTMAQSLSSATSDIPLVRASAKRVANDLEMFGHNTAAAVREGSQNAVVGAIERAVRTLQSNGYDPTIVLTGGDASRILKSLDEAVLHRPHLVLQGLAHMLESAP